jgi:hypothetical protein
MIVSWLSLNVLVLCMLGLNSVLALYHEIVFVTVNKKAKIPNCALFQLSLDQSMIQYTLTR